jgi:hypothetical protein
MCCWKITSSVADTVTFILLCGCCGRNLPQNTRDYAVLKIYFYIIFKSYWNIKTNLSFKTTVSRKSSAQYKEIFRHTLSPYCISTTSFPCCSWESNSDSRLLPHWLEHGGLCISGDVFSYFEVPKRTLKGNKK